MNSLVFVLLLIGQKPDLYFAGKTPEEGTKVTVTTHVTYTWHNGKLVKDEDYAPWELSWIEAENGVRLTRHFTKDGMYFSKQKPAKVYRGKVPQQGNSYQSYNYFYPVKWNPMLGGFTNYYSDAGYYGPGGMYYNPGGFYGIGSYYGY